MGGAQTVGSGVAAAQDNHPFAFGGDVFLRVYLLAGQQFVLLGEVVHCQVDAVQLTARHRQIPGLGGAAGEAYSVKLGQQLFHRVVDTHVNPGPKFHSLLGHQLDATVDYPLIQLEVGNTQHQQAADVVGPLQDGNRMAGPVKLLGGGQPGGAGTDHCNLLAGALLRRLRLYPAFPVAPVGDFLLDVFDSYRVGVDAENAGGFAGSRANPPGELREIVGAQQHFQRLAPLALIDVVVKFRDDVAQGTTHVAKGNGAVHASGTLFPGGGFRPIQVEFLVVPFPFGDGAAFRWLPPRFDKSSRFTHGELLPVLWLSCVLPALGDNPGALFS